MPDIINLSTPITVTKVHSNLRIRNVDISPERGVQIAWIDSDTGELVKVETVMVDDGSGNGIMVIDTSFSDDLLSQCEDRVQSTDTTMIGTKVIVPVLGGGKLGKP